MTITSERANELMAIAAQYSDVAKKFADLVCREFEPKETQYRLNVPLELHPNTADLVARFADALANKLLDAQRKYGYSDSWRSPEWMDECRNQLLEHVAKGDVRDVAAYCAFLWHHGQSTGVNKPSVEQERELFECWYEADAMPCEGDWFKRDPDEPDEYDSPNTHQAWEAWKFRAGL